LEKSKVKDDNMTEHEENNRNNAIALDKAFEYIFKKKEEGNPNKTILENK